MKILLVIHHHLDANSGAPGSVLKLGQMYRDLGHEVDYYSFDNLPSWCNTEVLFPLFVAGHLLKQCWSQDLDVIDAASTDAWFWGSLVQYLSPRRPLLVTRSHGLEHAVHLQLLKEVSRGNEQLSWKYPLYRGSIKLWEAAQSFRCAQLCFLLNTADRSYISERLGVDLERTHVTPNGIPNYLLGLPAPRPIYQEILPQTLPTPQPIQIAVIGTYIPRKGIKYSVPALGKILKNHGHVSVSFLGTGVSEADVLTDFGPELRLRVNVIPHFEHQELPSLLVGHQITLFTPLVEGFGKALIEAMACGLAPIASMAEGPQDILTHEQDGLLVPLQDTSAIETALEQLITHRQQRQKLQANAYKTAQNYSWLACARQRIALYQSELPKSAPIAVVTGGSPVSESQC